MSLPAACAGVRPYLTAQSPDELPTRLVGPVRAHLAVCAACRAVAGRYAALSAAVRSASATEVEPPPGFAADVMTRIRSREHHSRRRLLPVPPVPPAEIARVLQDNREAILAAAGTAAVAAGAAWLAWQAIRAFRPRAGTA